MANTGAITAATIGATLALTLAGSAIASDWKFAAGVGATETYSDNITLAPSGAAKSDWVTQVTPSFSVLKNGARLKVDAHYSMQNLFYAVDSSRNTTYHQLDAHANAELYEKEIFLDTAASVTQAATSLLGARGVDNTNATGNITDVRTITASPYWVHRFGGTALLNARYSVSDVSYGRSSLFDSTIYTTSLGLMNGAGFSSVIWGLNYQDQQVDYRSRSDVSFTTTSASLGYLITPKFKLIGTGGDERNSYATSEAATGGSFWNVDMSWAPSVLTSLDLGFGHHYYGKTWNMAFKTRGAYYEWTANYSDFVTTSNSQAGSSGYAGGALGGVRDIYQLSSSTLTNVVYLNKRFATAFKWKKGKSDFSVDAFHSIQTTQIDQTSNLNVTGFFFGATQSGSSIFQDTNNIKQVGINGAWKWQLTPLMSSSVSASIVRSTYSGLSREDRTSSVRIGLDRKFSPKFTGNVSLRRQVQDSNQNASDYTENALSGSVNYAF